MLGFIQERLSFHVIGNAVGLTSIESRNRHSKLTLGQKIGALDVRSCFTDAWLQSVCFLVLYCTRQRACHSQMNAFLVHGAVPLNNSNNNNNNNDNNNYDSVYGAIIMSDQSHRESSPGSSDECRLNAGWPPTLRPSQSTWAVSPSKTGRYHPHPHPPSPLLLLLSP